MHGYCNCKSCNTEWTARNYYQIGDDAPAPVRSKKPKAKPKREGCPANNGGRHVYVWVEYRATYISPWNNKWRTDICWNNECVGCKRRSTKYTPNRPSNVYAVVETNRPCWPY